MSNGWEGMAMRVGDNERGGTLELTLATGEVSLLGSLQATPLQLIVWQALQAIPVGRSFCSKPAL